MKHEEDAIQRALFQWITLATPRIPQLALAFHCPNGGRRDAREAARLKGMGVRPGVPDVMIPASKEYYDCGGELRFVSGLAIELKAKKGTVTASQREWHERLGAAGWHVHVCRSFDEARQLIADYFGVKP